jgi:hypothetical protein
MITSGEGREDVDAKRMTRKRKKLTLPAPEEPMIATIEPGSMTPLSLSKIVIGLSSYFSLFRQALKKPPECPSPSLSSSLSLSKRPSWGEKDEAWELWDG